MALHAGFAVTGVATTLIGPILPILIARWSLSDQRAGLFFTAQFCGSMAGVASIRWLIGRGYRQTFVCGFILIAAGVAGLNLGSNGACLGATFVFGCGLGQALSTANLWVAEIAKARRVAALSILNLQWGIGAIACSPLVMLAQRHEATPLLLCALGGRLCAYGLDPGRDESILQSWSLQKHRRAEEQPKLGLREGISRRSTFSLAALFFLYVGSENSVAGWVASLTKRMNSDSGDLWALAPMFFWGGLIVGRALVPMLPLRRSERNVTGERFDPGCRRHLRFVAGKDLRERRVQRDRSGIRVGCDLSNPGCVDGEGIWRKVEAHWCDHVRTCGNGRCCHALVCGSDVDAE